MRVNQVMSGDVIVASTSTSYKELARLMLGHKVSGLPVVAGDGSVVGMVTDGDLLRRLGFAHQSEHRTARWLAHLLAGAEPYVVRRCEGVTAADLMTRPVVTVNPDDDVRAAARLMVRKGIKRLPVLRDGRLVGVVARPDLMRMFERRDEDIQADVAAALADPMLAPEDNQVAAEVDDGIVTLTGTVRFPSHQADVAAAARRVAGVIDVRNLVTAREPEPALQEVPGYLGF
jgi:CBS domain-containing protein